MGSFGEMKGPTKIYLSSVACINLMKPDKALNETLVAPSHSKANFLIIFRGTDFAHTAMEYLRHVQDLLFIVQRCYAER
jgi:hypothetical protein